MQTLSLVLLWWHRINTISTLRKMFHLMWMLFSQDLPANERRVEEIWHAQDNDPLCQEVARYCQEGWPEKGWIKGLVNGCYPVSSEISIVDGLFMRNEWLIIPSALQKQVLEQLHTGHQGIGMCCERARQTVWWPGWSSEIQDVVGKCRLYG